MSQQFQPDANSEKVYSFTSQEADQLNILAQIKKEERREDVRRMIANRTFPENRTIKVRTRPWFEFRIKIPYNFDQRDLNLIVEALKAELP